MTLLSDKGSSPPEGFTKKQWQSIAGWKRATAKLAELGHLTSDQRDEVIELIEFRNLIAHEVHNLFADIGTSRANREALRDHEHRSSKYDYKKLTQIQNLKTGVFDRIASNFTMKLELERVAFESTSRFIEYELKRLRGRIDLQISHRREEMRAVREEISRHATKWDWHSDFYPTHPKYYKRNGALSADGVVALEGLFAEGISDLACALMMNLSVRSVRLRRQKRQTNSIHYVEPNQAAIAAPPS